jgi:hypothetical protein
MFVRVSVAVFVWVTVLGFNVDSVKAVLFDMTDPNLPDNSGAFAITDMGVTFFGSNPIGDVVDAGNDLNRFVTDEDGVLVGDDDLLSFDFSFDAPVELNTLTIGFNDMVSGTVTVTWENTVTTQSATVNIGAGVTGNLVFPTPVVFAVGQAGQFTSGGTPVGEDSVQISALGASQVPEPSSLSFLGLIWLVATYHGTKRRRTVANA